MREKPLLLKVERNGKTSGSTPQKEEIGKKLGQGTYGSIKEVTLTLGRNGKERELILAKKTFKVAEDALQSAYVYALLKSLGMKVPTTYRINRRNPQEIFMTNYATNGQKVISTNILDGPNNFYIEKILNLEELVAKMKEQCEIATKNRLVLNEDCFFFILPEEEIATQARPDFVIADFDSIEKADPSMSEDRLLSLNLEYARVALQTLGTFYPPLNRRIIQAFKNDTDDDERSQLINSILNL